MQVGNETRATHLYKLQQIIMILIIFSAKIVICDTMIIPTNCKLYHNIIFDYIMFKVMKSYAFVCLLDAITFI